ncbi:hypothetical protein Tco_0955331 [Tanacetum coccineum]|uniref:Uncharacterized protein n=1 Tax=Tanacetum coccineum TaxID=301880 RepID=A0ABQ5E6Z9_9ASTR
MKYVSFSSFFVLQPNQLGAGQCDHGPLTSPELRTASCDLPELAIPERSLNSLVNNISDDFIHRFAHVIRNIMILQIIESEEPCCGGGGIGGRVIVVVVVAVAVAVNVGSGA